MEGDIRIDLREKIFREVVANHLIHREFTDAFPARLIIFRDRLVTENANNPVGSGPIDPNNFSPHPKNPAIVKFFQQLGRAEELGSGIRNIRKYLPFYSQGSKFTFEEEDTFRTTISFETVIKKSYQEGSLKILALVKDDNIDELKSLLNKKLGAGWEKKKKKLGENQIKIIALIIENKFVSIKIMAETLKISNTAIKNHISKLKKQGLIKRIGPDKGGHWEIKR